MAKLLLRVQNYVKQFFLYKGTQCFIRDKIEKITLYTKFQLQIMPYNLQLNLG